MKVLSSENFQLYDILSHPSIIPSQVHMPDLEMIVNLGDWPLNKDRPNHPLLPVFSWCGSPDTRDIIWPTWDMMKATIMALDRWVWSVGGATSY